MKDAPRDEVPPSVPVWYNPLVFPSDARRASGEVPPDSEALPAQPAAPAVPTGTRQRASSLPSTTSRQWRTARASGSTSQSNAATDTSVEHIKDDNEERVMPRSHEWPEQTMAPAPPRMPAPPLQHASSRNYILYDPQHPSGQNAQSTPPGQIVPHNPPGQIMPYYHPGQIAPFYPPGQHVQYYPHPAWHGWQVLPPVAPPPSLPPGAFWAPPRLPIRIDPRGPGMPDIPVPKNECVRTVYIGNLRKDYTEAHLRDYLIRSLHVPVVEAVEILYQSQGHAVRSRGFGFATFRDRQIAEYVILTLNNSWRPEIADGPSYTLRAGWSQRAEE